MLLGDEDEARAYVRDRCSDVAYRGLELLAARLRNANVAQNLVAAGSLPSLWLRHIADSAQLLDHVSRETGPWLDFGSGAGFPGLVIAIMRPDREVALIEARNLRIQWLRGMIAELDLPKCRVIGQDVRRIETIEAGVISARAFAPLPRLVELSARFSTNATEWVLPKGRLAAQDIAALPNSVRTRFHVKQSVTDPEAKIVVAQGRMGP